MSHREALMFFSFINHKTFCGSEEMNWFWDHVGFNFIWGHMWFIMSQCDAAFLFLCILYTMMHNKEERWKGHSLILWSAASWQLSSAASHQTVSNCSSDLIHLLLPPLWGWGADEELKLRLRALNLHRPALVQAARMRRMKFWELLPPVRHPEWRWRRRWRSWEPRRWVASDRKWSSRRSESQSESAASSGRPPSGRTWTPSRCC